MREEIKNFLEIEQAGTSNMRNGYYQRNLDTQYGRIEGLLVPRGRNGEFQTQLFAPYQRHTGWLEEAIIKMYQSGMSTREIGKFIERILGNAYSPTTISHITDVVKEDIVKWHTRPLPKRYSVLYLDGLYVKFRRETVEKEVIYMVLGVNEEGYREILDFFVGGQESAYVWQRKFFKASTKEASRKCFWAYSMDYRDWRRPLRRFIRKPMCSVVSFTKSATPSVVFGKKISSKWRRI
ncbi:hypothetical protein B4119_3502 [Parageobacillus caldoxylosilyticus]|uniref:Mutator family transposase n=1 Tax=Saccharococcus caldoxylosilyticus TaxID=81408 RepID=A0A150L608_9BACL|nr:hypothetical protein B4119_3502 [Parageobacillus caldoxylosilyticus]